MGVYKHLLGDPASVAAFRHLYSIPANVEVKLDGPNDGLVMDDSWMPFWLVTVVEAGVRFPFHPLIRDCLREWNLCPCQLLPNGYKIIMGAVQLNKILGIDLSVADIEETYDLCKSTYGNTHYLWLRVGRAGFVTVLEDSNRYAGEDRVSSREDGSSARQKLTQQSKSLVKWESLQIKAEVFGLWLFFSFSYLPD